MNVTDTINQDKTPPHGHSGAPSIMPSAFEEPFREPLVLGIQLYMMLLKKYRVFRY